MLPAVGPRKLKTCVALQWGGRPILASSQLKKFVSWPSSALVISCLSVTARLPLSKPQFLQRVVGTVDPTSCYMRFYICGLWQKASPGPLACHWPLVPTL